MTADRFDRQRRIDGWDQSRLAGASVIIVGVGALGNETAKNLALAGVGRLVLCDPDTVAASNLSRCVLFAAAGPAALGRPKVEVAAAGLRALAPGVEVATRPGPLSGVGLGELAAADLVLGCLDSRRSRLDLLGRCALAQARLVDGGTHPWGGEVRLRLAADDPCWGCTLPAAWRAETDLPWGCSDPVDDAPAPASILSTAIVAGWLSLLAVRLLHGEQPAGRLLRIDGLAGRMDEVVVSRDPGCPHHRPLIGVEPLALTCDATVADLLARLPDGAEPQTWEPFHLPDRCARCGGAPGSATTPGAAGSPRCDQCGIRMRPRTSQRIRDAEPADTLRALGVAPREILPVQLRGGEFRWRQLTR
ncbi:ThiF family adenylyltransferase [Frankia sp. QA3]|uniref:HesA/MoeB/ThiF family protein n=1 Tax=Frankia sp. QA3 TaxID=710111 RepID=UPI000269C518|nr:ThiF family adenylyltransferase [Frankia sp. QA3]EIV94372.1 dinucleotide-utilizing enzyme possibly involved in molybdopterin or thiamin biosynthesis [Frankia sp. QA3]